MTGLMDAFAAKIRSHGGEIRLGVGVEQILFDGTRASGVRLTDGTELRAGHGVLASCAPQVALGKLLPAGKLDRQLTNKVAMIPANSVNSAAFKIDVAFGGRVDYPKAAAKRRDGFDVRRTTLMTGTLEEHMSHLQSMKRGEIVEVPPVYMSVLSASDPTIAPAGQDVLYLHSNVPAGPVGGWQANKDLYTQTIVKSAGRFLDGLDAEIGRIVHTPKGFRGPLLDTEGLLLPCRHDAATPWHQPPGPRARRVHHAVRGPVPGRRRLYPGGTVSGWCGRLAAQQAIKSEG